MDSPKPPASPPPPTTTTAPGNHHALDNLKSLLMKCAIASTPAKSLTLPQKTFIEKRIQDFFPTIHTPDHPPYAWMIENAIKQLNEEGGSNEEAISKFILEEYHDLPWSHAALLKHHLKKLSESGNLVEVHGGCYLIGKASITLNRTSKRTPTLTYMNSPSPSLSLSYSPSPSPSSSSSSSSTYESSSSSSSSHSFCLTGKGRKRKKKNHKRKWSQRRKQSARGIKVHPKYKEVRRRGRGRGRGRGRVEVEAVVEAVVELAVGVVVVLEVEVEVGTAAMISLARRT
ncbi:UNVERIFIED_CONTAM: hypothetical protein Sradi_0651700 [Sesamum radiatum]|uniref:H15 domain-containing protein n=1 Tax=Sesamum radiatum TaxID=300843 RepID=A0AAW2VLA3_SESRA